MANEYKSIYLKDMIPLIDAVTLDCMMTPALTMKKLDGTVASLTEMSHYNTLVSMHNKGVREMGRRLKEKLLEDDQDE